MASDRRRSKVVGDCSKWAEWARKRGRKEGLRERERGMNKCMYYKHANERGGERASERGSEHACKRQERRERGREGRLLSLSRSPFNVDFKSQIATHERESCVLKHEREA